VKAEAILVILLVAVCIFPGALGNSSPYPFSEQSLPTTIPSGGKDSLFGSSTSLAPELIANINDGQGRSNCVILDNHLGLSLTTVGNSTIINTPSEVRDKIDANLLNLTRLLTEGYLDGNQTRIIISLSTGNTIDQTVVNQASVDSICGVEIPYISQRAGNLPRFLTARLNYSAIFELSTITQVDHIWLDRTFRACLDQSVRIIKNPVQWSNVESAFGRSINGSRTKIAILDTGIDTTHPDFKFPNGTSKIIASTSFTGEPTDDGYGHGTHVASIAVGTGGASSGQYVGIAPGATLLNVKILDNQGHGEESQIISGIQWAVDHNASVLNMSFGTATDGDGTDPLSMTVDWATSQGAVCVVAAGNSGPDMYTLNTPAIAGSAITVGASTKGDAVPDFSSRGPTNDGRIKPDVVAPGVDIIAARATGTSLGTPVSEYYTRLTGTSMAAPHIAGAAALLLDAFPTWNPFQIKNALANYAENIGATVIDQGTGRINVCRSANALFTGNSSITFGKVHLNTNYQQLFTLQNLASGAIGISLSAQTWHLSDRTLYNVASVNMSTLSLSSNGTHNVELNLNTYGTLPNGYFEGEITASSGDTSIEIIFFFYILSQVNVEVLDESSQNLKASFVLIDADTGSAVKHFTECDRAEFTTIPGDYFVQAMNIYAEGPSQSLNLKVSFLVHQRFTLRADETIDLYLSLASAYKLQVRSTDVDGNSIYLVRKHILSPYFTMEYLAEIGQLSDQSIYLTKISDFTKAPCFFGFAGFTEPYDNWKETGTLTSEVNTYSLYWDLSGIGLSIIPSALNYTNSELAIFNIDPQFPKSSSNLTMWLNPVSGLWRSGFWLGYQTYPGIRWKAYLLPYQYKNPPSALWSQLEWSCQYTLSARPDTSPENFLIDRHFEPIAPGENLSYTMGKTPLLPQEVMLNPPNCGDGLYIPYYPLHVERNLYLAPAGGTQGTKRLEVLKNGIVISNTTRNWEQDSVPISQFLGNNGYGLYSFIIKTQTTLNFSSQNIAEYVINYTNTNSNLIPPSIQRIDCDPSFAGSSHQIQIQLTSNGTIRSVSLLYSIDNGPCVPAILTNLGNYKYSADLTVPPSAQNLSLTVEGIDENGNRIRYSTSPAASRGYETRIDAQLDGDVVTGTLNVNGGTLTQPLCLKVRSAENTMYTLTDASGNFQFTVPEYLHFPIELELNNMGPYRQSTLVLDTLQIHDISLLQLTTSKTVTGGNLKLNATILNRGDTTENFRVIIYANATSVTFQYCALPSKLASTFAIEWNTTSYAKGNYTLTGLAEPVSGETNTQDNACTGGIVMVTVLGDINGDGRVNMADIGKMCRAYLVRPGNSLWDPNADLNNDNLIDMRDIGTACSRFCQHI
jgi:serine protease AprX